jgi:hypothetical protein
MSAPGSEAGTISHGDGGATSGRNQPQQALPCPAPSECSPLTRTCNLSKQDRVADER